MNANRWGKRVQHDKVLKMCFFKHNEKKNKCLINYVMLIKAENKILCFSAIIISFIYNFLKPITVFLSVVVVIVFDVLQR